MRRAVQGPLIQSMKSGEGWVFDFNGPGRVLLQSRNPEAFAEWVAQAVPSEQPAAGHRRTRRKSVRLSVTRRGG